MFKNLSINDVYDTVSKQKKSPELIAALLADGRKGLLPLANRLNKQLEEEAIYKALWTYESNLWQESKVTVGLDEAGRGPLAGPVVAAAVVFNQIPDLVGIKDSKKLNDETKEYLHTKIKEQATAYAVSFVDHNMIDEINILNASKLAMVNATKSLGTPVDVLLIDGNFTIDYQSEQIPVVKGDAKVGSIAAASILAKVYRDNHMMLLHEKYPMYNFAGNKGYPTQEHYWAIKKYGPSPVHRLTFKGVCT